MYGFHAICTVELSNEGYQMMDLNYFFLRATWYASCIRKEVFF